MRKWKVIIFHWEKVLYIHNLALNAQTLVETSLLNERGVCYHIDKFKCG